jgi:hypothetical protein
MVIDGKIQDDGSGRCPSITDNAPLWADLFESSTAQGSNPHTIQLTLAHLDKPSAPT